MGGAVHKRMVHCAMIGGGKVHVPAVGGGGWSYKLNAWRVAAHVDWAFIKEGPAHGVDGQ